MNKNCITDIDGISVGQVSDKSSLTGCTVVLLGDGAVCGVEVRGSAPGTRETDLLNPKMSNERVNAVLLSGGSAFGLAAADGVMQYMEECGKGVDVGVVKVPIVTGAVIFDLLVGRSDIRPDKKMGYLACKNASQNKICEGNEGAGTGATVGKILGERSVMKSGIGSASVVLDNGLKVGAIVVVNAFGDIRDNVTGEILAGALSTETNMPVDTEKFMIDNYDTICGSKNVFQNSRANTTIGVVATNAKLTKAQCSKLAEMAINGLIRVISPFGTSVDGDTVFGVSLGDKTANLDFLGVLASKAMSSAVINAVKAAEPIGHIEAYRKGI